MSFETVERLKRDYTDKWVTVDTATPEPRRFVGLSGQIKTVNMNGRALVQFDNPVDISWYDIDLSYLNVINGPLPKKVAEKHEPAEKKPAAAPKPVATGGKSPLELAREQAAAKAAAGSAPAAPAAAATGDKPLSKLELARQQAAAAAKARAGGAEPTAAAPAATTPAPAAAPAAPVTATPAPATPAFPAVMLGEDGKPLSKLEMARRQGAAKPK